MTDYAIGAGGAKFILAEFILPLRVRLGPQVVHPEPSSSRQQEVSDE
ncbi:unnamed protein product [marine sediment metagenome]|uniref:Uncharacterized protein n=1 Tax=marine sediment metagenome TaxID=412755 RepID=X1G747_9ZZZZ